MAEAPTPLQSRIRWAGLVLGPLLAALAYALLPERYADASGAVVEFSAAGRATLAAMIWMGLWWITEAIPISATALLPLAVFPLAGVRPIADTAAPFADKLIFLFMGGFLLALAMQRWGLDRRIALITLRLVGTRPVNMVAGFMIATAVLSAFVSNTATAAMMLPIGLSVIDLVLRGRGDATIEETGALPADAGRNFALCVMLGIAYAASIGGIATIIGTPPNVILVGFIRGAYGHEIGFAQWMLVGVPLAAVFLPVTWLLLTRVLYPIRIGRIEGGREFVEQAHRQLGPVKPGEWITFAVFTLTALAWIGRSLAAPALEARGVTLPIDDTGIVMAAALLLFVIPVDRRGRERVLDWSTAQKLPFGILILFGGGLSLAAAVRANGVAEYFGSLASGIAGAPTVVLVLVIATAVIFLTELTSNTATTATLVPILAGMASGLAVHPYLLIVPAAIAASCAFMMPVATPPNAIVFGSGYITIPQMCRAGLALNLVGVVLVTLLALLVVMRVLGPNEGPLTAPLPLP